MSQKQSLARLPRDIGHKVAALLDPLSLASLDRAFTGLNLTFSLTPRLERSARVWDMVFKNSLWVNTAKRARDPVHRDLTPTLVGCNLLELYKGSSKTAYIALVMIDRDICNPSMEKELFASLREHTYDEQNYEVHFQNSNIILNVRNAVTGQGWISMDKPERLTRSLGGDLVTSMLYFGDERLDYFSTDVEWRDNPNHQIFGNPDHDHHIVGPAQQGTEYLFIYLRGGSILVWDR